MAGCHPRAATFGIAEEHGGQIVCKPKVKTVVNGLKAERQAMTHSWIKHLPARAPRLAALGLLSGAVLAGGAALAQETDQQYCDRQEGPAKVACLRDLKSAAPAAAKPAGPATPAATGTAAPAAPTAATTAAAAAPAGAGGPAPYKVVDGYHVDAQTLKGFQTWRSAACDRCHGANQEGLVGPSLVNSLKTLSKADFVKTVTNGRLEKGMPSFGGSPAVIDNIDQLYAYLKGRSDGAITKSHVEAIQ